MLLSEVSVRYAKALYDLACKSGTQDKVSAELRELNKVLAKDSEVVGYVQSPLVKPSEKEQVLKAALAKGDISEETSNFVLTLAKKNRLNFFSQTVEAFQNKRDADNGVSRGVVRSANVLAPEERTEIEKIVEKATGKKVILSYEEDPDIIGGLIAKVGSYTFDDTLTSHLKRLRDDLKRSAH